ncbi:uncharacterized protein V6R79_022156 [Siganus canaliculatus]
MMDIIGEVYRYWKTKWCAAAAADAEAKLRITANNFIVILSNTVLGQEKESDLLMNFLCTMAKLAIWLLQQCGASAGPDGTGELVRCYPAQTRAPAWLSVPLEKPKKTASFLCSRQ